MMRTAEQIFSKWCLLPMRMLTMPRQLIYRSLKHSAPCIYRYSSPAPEHELAEQSLAISIPPPPLQRRRDLHCRLAHSFEHTFPVKYIPACSFAKIKESYVLQLVYLKCFLTTLERDLSKQKGLDNFLLVTG